MIDKDKLWRLVTGNDRELRMVAGNLLGAAGRQRVHTFLMTSCRPGEGRTVAAASFAYALAAHAARSVLLVDASSGSPQIHDLFGAPRSPGLVELLMKKATREEIVHPTAHANLSVVAYGSGDSGAAEALQAGRFAEGLASIEEDFDHVVVDGDPVLTSSHTLTVANAFDGVVVVVESGKTKWEVVDLARSKIQQVGGHVLGVVLNQRKYHVPRLLYKRV